MKDRDNGTGELAAADVTERVGTILGAAERMAGEVRHEAEQDAQVVRREAEQDAQQRRERAEAEAQRYLEQARRQAEELAAGRARRMSELGDSIIERAQSILEQLEHADAVKRQLHTLVHALGETAERVASETVPTSSPVVAALEELERVEDAQTGQRTTVEPAETEKGRRNGERAAGDSHDPTESGRLVALQMAVAGGTRSEVEAHLRRAFDLVDPAAVLDDVFGEGTPGEERIHWSETVNESPG